MVNVLDRMGLTRDSVIWWLLAIAGAATFGLEHFDLLQRAFPGIAPVWHARIELLGAAAAGVALYLRASPLAQNGTLGLRSDPERTLTITGKPSA